MSKPTHRPPACAVPPLRNGDTLSREEFERRYDAMPDLKKAELINGVVYIPADERLNGEAVMSSPVSDARHGEPHFNLISWLGYYRAFTPGLAGSDNPSLRVPTISSEPQPDCLLRLLPNYGGQSRTSTDGYLEGAPELIAEISASRVSYDLNAKLVVYRENAVREYLVWRVDDGEIDWFVLQSPGYGLLPLQPDGTLRSEIFPGLWLDPVALVRGDLATVLRTLQRGMASPEYAQFVARLQQIAAANPMP